jgi:hypothetical protein
VDKAATGPARAHNHVNAVGRYRESGWSVVRKMLTGAADTAALIPVVVHRKVLSFILFLQHHFAKLTTTGCMSALLATTAYCRRNAESDAVELCPPNG